VKFVPHPHRLQKVDSIDSDNNGTVGGRQLATNGRELKSAANKVTSENLMWYVLLLRVHHFPGFSDEPAGPETPESRFILRPLPH